jgi:hypothetical protein
VRAGKSKSEVICIFSYEENIPGSGVRQHRAAGWGRRAAELLPDDAETIKEELFGTLSDDAPPDALRCEVD